MRDLESTSGDQSQGARDDLVSEDLRMMLPSFFTKETGMLHRV